MVYVGQDMHFLAANCKKGAAVSCILMHPYACNLIIQHSNRPVDVFGVSSDRADIKESWSFPAKKSDILALINPDTVPPTPSHSNGVTTAPRHSPLSSPSTLGNTTPEPNPLTLPGDCTPIRGGWDPRCAAIIAKAPPECMVDWKIVYREPMETWVSPLGRMSLIGDAAHPFVPYVFLHFSFRRSSKSPCAVFV